MGRSIKPVKTRKTWDELLIQTGKVHPFGESWVLDLLCPHGWTGYMDESTGALLALPRRLLAGVPVAALQPFFLRSCGIYSSVSLTEEQCLAFRKALPKTLIKVALYWNQPVLGYTGKRRIYQRLDLRNPFEFKGNVVRNLKKCHRFNLEFFEPEPICVQKTFYNFRGKDMPHLSGKPRERMDRWMEEAQKRNCGWFLGFRDENEQVHAAGFFLESGNGLLYVHGGASDVGKKSGAMFLLMSEAINRAKQKGLEWFDFGGSNVPSVAEFYRGFGAEDEVYYEIS